MTQLELHFLSAGGSRPEEEARRLRGGVSADVRFRVCGHVHVDGTMSDSYQSLKGIVMLVFQASSSVQSSKKIKYN